MTITLFTTYFTITFSGCKKEPTLVNTGNNQVQTQPVEDSLEELTCNPYSLRNIEKAAATLRGISTNKGAVENYSTATNSIASYPNYVYYKFKIENITKEQFLALENDTTTQLLDFPFGNPNIYNEKFALDEKKAAKLRDGFIYGVTKLKTSGSGTINKLVAGKAKLQLQLIDTIVKMPDGDTSLLFQSLRQAGYSNRSITAFLGLCFFKKPHGYVYYRDADLGKNQPVVGMQVWGVRFGLPVHAYTDENGRYQFSEEFSFGTIMGTHAKNNRVNIKPLNTVGNWPQVVGQLAADFLLGSVYIRGWVSSCNMRGDVNYDFSNYDQHRYWCELLNAYSYHDKYTKKDDILNAPQGMVCYAQWASRSDIGSGSTPMLHQMSSGNYVGGTFTDQYLTWLFAHSLTGSLSTVIHALLPDMSFSVPGGGTSVAHYNSRLSQIALHELGHASMFRKVGPTWYAELVFLELSHVNSRTIYGNADYVGWGKVALAESWAEFIGTYHGNNIYGAKGFKKSVFFGYSLKNYPTSLKYEDWFSNTWIPSGLFWHLMDNTFDSGQYWDKVGGATVKSLYNALGSEVTSICGYNGKFKQYNPAFDNAKTDALFLHYNNVSVNCW